MDKKVLIGIVCLIVLIIVCVLVFNNNGKKQEKPEDKENKVTNLLVNNKVDGNLNSIKKDENGNIIVDGNGLVELNVPISNNDIYEKDSTVGSTEKKQEAIELVKQTWGEDSTVSFRCDSVTNNGEYIIAVVSNETASVKNFFIVNLETKSVEPDV